MRTGYTILRICSRVRVLSVILGLCALHSYGVVPKLDSSSLDFRNRVEKSADIQTRSFLETLPRNVLIIEPYHGLGNRLRAYASAAALARKSGRGLVVVWLQDSHLNASMSSLFDTSHLTIVNFPVQHLLSTSLADVVTYDYNKRGGKDEVLYASSPAPIYVRSAYVLQSQPKVSETEITVELNKLVISAQVKDRVQHLRNKLQVEMAGQREMIGVHIRMNSDILTDVPGIQAVDRHHPAGVESMGPVAKERRRCTYAAFIPHMQRALETNPDAVFFISSDTREATLRLREKFGTRALLGFPAGLNGCDGSTSRTTRCLQNCLAEFFVMSKYSSSLILSSWSSASELILRMNAGKAKHEIGCFPPSSSWLGLGFLR